MYPGLYPIPFDKRDASYAGTFRGFGQAKVIPFSDNFTVDLKLDIPDQNTTGYFFSCTGHTQTNNLQDEMGVKLDPIFTYKKTCIMEGHEPDQGCQIRPSLKSTRVYGVRKENDDPNIEVTLHKGGKYFNVYDDGGLPWFDAIRDAIRREKKGVSCGTPWFPTWNTVASHGVLPMPTGLELETARKRPNSLLWHNYSCKGWKTINGKPYLRIKPWLGKNYGDDGWLYMSREVANEVFELRGSGVFIQSYAKPEDIVQIKIDILQTVINYLYRIIGLQRLN